MKFCAILALHLCITPAGAQRTLRWTWTPIPVAGTIAVKAYQGFDSVNVVRAFYLDADMNDLSIEVKPAVANGSGEPASKILSRVTAFAGVNGGFFGGGQPLGLVMSDGQIMAQPLASVTRGSTIYYLTRAAFGIDNERHLSTTWAYNWTGKLYAYPSPNPNRQGAPAPPPNPQNFTPPAVLWKVFHALGGGPNLISKGAVNITYEQEVMFGSGVGLDNPDPRTAVGYTASKHVILFVVDGRQAGWSTGLNLHEMAQTLLALGCVEAISLDGGGSSTFVVNDTVLNRPSDGRERSITNVLAVVPADTVFEIELIYDTIDTNYHEVGAGWFDSANPGYHGTTPSRLNPVGTGSDYAFWNLHFPSGSPMAFRVFAWWVPASNRAADTPFIVHHASGIDTIRVDQTVGANRWNEIGLFRFSGSSGEKILISDAAARGQYVVADAIRLVREAGVAVRSRASNVPRSPVLLESYPNPFHAETVISYQFSVINQQHISLKIYNLLGEEVRALVNADQRSGFYRAIWDGKNNNGRIVTSGVYLLRLAVGEMIATKKLAVIR
jgi:hypothetical protein